MTCALDLTVLDLDQGLLLDMGLYLGTNKSAWGEVIDEFIKESGRTLNFYSSERDLNSLDGVRCWWTDSREVMKAFVAYISGHGDLHSVCSKKQVESMLVMFPERNLRFIMSLV
jgi:hypothetical protein